MLKLANLGFIAQEQGDYTVAQALFEESLALAREVGDKVSIAHSSEEAIVYALERAKEDLALDLSKRRRSLS